MARPITAGLEPFRKDPAHVVQMLPRKAINWTPVGHALAVLVGVALAVLLLAWEGSL